MEKMKSSGQWGEFFRPEDSAFAYNNSTASIYFPLTKEEILARGWAWEDIPDSPLGGTDATVIPDSIDEIDDALLDSVLTCPVSRKQFKIQKKELEIYRILRLPCARLHPDVRISRRRDMMNPYILHDRKCSKCGKGIRTTFAPEKTEKVYCEECYLKKVY